MSSWSPLHEQPPETAGPLIERARQALIAGDTEDRSLLRVRPVIRESWERSRHLSIDEAVVPGFALGDRELAEYRSTHPLAEAMELIRGLLLPGDAADSGVVVAVGDRAGRFLWVEGDLSARVRLGEIGVVGGADWSESTIGTNAPGTALAIGESVQTFHAEHYSSIAHRWSCTAAPVLDPETRRILGVIDVSGGPEAVTPQARLLVDATARAVESDILVRRLRARAEGVAPATPRRPRAATGMLLRVLGRDRAQLEVTGAGSEQVVELSARHGEILLALALHPQGLSAERLAELVYGEDAHAETLRPEMVRLRKVLQRLSPDLVPLSRPYRTPVTVETDAQNLLALLDRGAHRVALTAYRGPVLPGSQAPVAEQLRETVRMALRESMFAEASLDVLLAYSELPDAADDVELLRLCLEMVPQRSPKRAGLVARIERLQSADDGDG